MSQSDPNVEKLLRDLAARVAADHPNLGGEALTAAALTRMFEAFSNASEHIKDILIPIVGPERAQSIVDEGFRSLFESRKDDGEQPT